MAATPAVEDKALLETRHRGLVLLGVILVSVCQFLDATIAAIALPHMKAALGASNESISWVLTSFIITTAIFTPLTGWASDRIGSRNLFLLATLLFLVSSAACGMATSLSAMVVFRAIQGIAAAFIGAMTMTIMYDISPPSKQPMTMAYFSIIVMLAPISGPFLGGLLTEYLNWRWIFYINLPFGIPALILLWWLLPSRPLDRRRLDLFGFAAIAIALGSLQLLLDRGQHKDWFESWEIIIEAIIAVSGVWIFFVHSATARSPLFKPAILRNGNFLVGLAFMAIMGLTVTGLSAVLPMMFQSIYGYPVVDTGLMMAPRGFGVMITSLLAGRLFRLVDFRYMIALGYLIVSGSMWIMTSWSLEMGNDQILIANFVQGLGFGFIVAPMNLMAFATLAPMLRPDGASLMALFRSLGGSVGISVVVTMLARNQQVAHEDIASHVTSGTVPGVDLSAMADRMAGPGASVMAMIDGEVNRQALMIAFLDNFYWLAWLVLAFTVMPLLIKRPKTMPGPPLPAVGE